MYLTIIIYYVFSPLQNHPTTALLVVMNLGAARATGPRVNP